MYVLDTDHVSLYQQGNVQIGERLKTLAPKQLAVTVVSYEEQVAGRLAVARRAQTVEARVEAYRWLQFTLDFYCRVPVLQFNQTAGRILRHLQQLKLRVGTKDLLIGAITLANDATLLTRNYQDFHKLSGLKIEDWTVR
jgi:tRNA(fMet)-specific endonuclease VapC